MDFYNEKEAGGENSSILNVDNDFKENINWLTDLISTTCLK